MENNNGRGIFYGVIGVATLIVAMIGATFAYFSASVTTENNPVAFNSTSIDLGLTQNTAGIKYNLIPVDETLDGFATGGYVGNATVRTAKSANCIDDDGNEFCSVYEVTVTNPSPTTAQTIYAQMNVAVNTFNVNTPTTAAVYETVDGEQVLKEAAKCSYLTGTGEEALYCGKTNVAFAIFKGTAANVIANTDVQWDVDSAATTTYYSSTGGSTENAFGDAVTATADTNTSSGNVAGTPVVGQLGDMVVARTAIAGSNDSITLNELSQTLKPGGSATYTIVMWLHENNTDQDDDEGQEFAAGITFSTSLNGSGVTAVLATTKG